LTVQSILGSFSLLFGLVGNEGVSLSAVVSIQHLSKLLKLSLEFLASSSDGHAVDEQLAVLRDCWGIVCGHLGMNGPSLAVLTIHLVFRH